MKTRYSNPFDELIEGILGNMALNKETKMAQTTITNGSIITTGSFIVGSTAPSTGVSFARDPAQHFSAAEARSECERLARLNPGKTFFFVEVKGGAYIPTATLTKF